MVLSGSAPAIAGGHLPALCRKQRPVNNWYGSSLFPRQVICIGMRSPHVEKEERQIVLLRHIPICYQPPRPSCQQPRLPLFLQSSHFTPRAHICSHSQPHPHPGRWNGTAASFTRLLDVSQNIHMVFWSRAPFLDCIFSPHFYLWVKKEWTKKGERGKNATLWMKPM